MAKKKQALTSIDDLLAGSALDLDKLTSRAGTGDNAALLGNDMEAMLDAAQSPVDDPFTNTQYTGAVEPDTEIEMSVMLKAFKQAANRDQDRFRLAVDSEFWFCVCFRSREQVDTYLNAKGWKDLLGDKYIDGTRLAKIEGIELPTVVLVNKKARPDDRLMSIADRRIGEQDWPIPDLEADLPDIHAKLKLDPNKQPTNTIDPVTKKKKAKK